MQNSTDWLAGGHDVSLAWYEWLAAWGPWVLAGALVAILAGCVARRGRYRAVRVLTDDDREAVREALRQAEARTVGEIVPVVVERSDDHPAADWLAGLAFLLIGTAVLAPHLPWNRPAAILGCQLLLLGAGFAVARLVPAFKRLFVRAGRANEVACEQAFQEFYGNGLHHTEAATGVLLFVSLLERRVVVLADEGIAERVPPEAWHETDAAILAGIARGSLRDGLIAGIRRAGDVLAEQFPDQDGDRNELPDRVIVRRS